MHKERLPSIDSDDNASGSLKEDDFQPTIDLPTHSQTKSNRWTYSELLTADDDADDLFGRGRNSQVIVESEEDDQIDVATVLEDKEVDDIMVRTISKVFTVLVKCNVDNLTN